MTARDLLYGRQAGRWADGHRDLDAARPCEICARPMHLGQRRRHAVCCPHPKATPPGSCPDCQLTLGRPAA